jgi:hypothetical protein
MRNRSQATPCVCVREREGERVCVCAQQIAGNAPAPRSRCLQQLVSPQPASTSEWVLILRTALDILRERKFLLCMCVCVYACIRIRIRIRIRKRICIRIYMCIYTHIDIEVELLLEHVLWRPQLYSIRQSLVRHNISPLYTLCLLHPWSYVASAPYFNAISHLHETSHNKAHSRRSLIATS